jgi:hypothetical protein
MHNTLIMKIFISCFLSFFVTVIIGCSVPEDNRISLQLDELDPEINEMIHAISADTIEKNIRRLANFGTRHTLSDTESDEFGIGAARRWIKEEMERYSYETGGRLEVGFHRFIQEPVNRIPDSTEIVNVVAKLPGTDLHDDRVYVVSGHYDSRATDIMDAESYLPQMEVWMIYRADRYLRGGDHLPFLNLGYPAVRFSEPHEDFRYQHQDIRMEDGVQYGDLPEFVDFDYVERVTQVNLAALANLARAPQPPRNVGMNISRLENDTRLRWEPSPSAHIKGYEVVWRGTTSPYWEEKAFVDSETTEFTAELISKDNYLFGVRAVSHGGHTGPAVYPFPFRE